MTWLIERAAEQDAPQISAISAQVHGPLSKPLLVTKELLNRSATLLVAKSEKQIVGYLDFWTVGDEAEIIHIATDAAHRRQGIAKNLLQTGLAHLDLLCERIFLEVRPSNTAARQLYIAAGFAQISLRRQYYSDGEDALVFSRSKPQP